jgi:hypothetical protein
MSVNLFNWVSAAELLGIPENEIGENWPKSFSAYDLAQLQESGNPDKRVAWEKVINAMPAHRN